MIRPVIGAVLVASALALFSVPTPAVIAAAVAAAAVLVSLQGPIRRPGVTRAIGGIHDEKLRQSGQQPLPAAWQPGTGTAKGEDDRARAR